MSCLLYGIVFSGSQSRADAPLNLPLGVGGVPVGLIEDGRVAAAMATLDPAALTPTVGSITAYANVVEVLHADRAVLPMRYGCVLGGEADVIQLLHARGEQYAEVLRGLEGCVEMGIRMLGARLSKRERARIGACSHFSDTLLAARGESLAAFDGRCIPAGCVAPQSNTPGILGRRALPAGRLARLGATPDFHHGLLGTAYLTRRQRVYGEADRHAHEIARSVERIRVAFDGLFLRCKMENVPTATGSVSSVPLFSLYFLVRRESLESFRHVFHRISRAEHGRFLLSGPWPPYNFVGSERG